MKKSAKLLSGIIIMSFALTVKGHFQVILPSASFVEKIPYSLSLKILFTHPMENGPVMKMGDPKQFGVMLNGKKESLLKYLKPDSSGFELSYKLRQPGDYIFFIEPAPYWEPAEEKMIVHYTKVIINAMGCSDGWDTMVGFPVEIEALVQPYALYTGSIFRGIVKSGGKPVPFAEIEVEYLNNESKYEAPGNVFITQVIKADSNGVFSYALPKAGWWGFAALIDGKEKMKNPEGKDSDVELGALIWVRAIDMKKKN